MSITPSTNLKLINVPIEIDNKNQLSFNGGKQEQFEYFNSLPSHSVDNFTYQRKDSTIRFPRNIDEILHYNYVMYQNENYSDKWFYAFITNMRYLNDNCTEITIKTDVFQTWYYDSAWRLSFIEREMIDVEKDIPRS